MGVKLGPATNKQGVIVDYWFICPGCKSEHAYEVNTDRGWQFNGDLEKPTFTPSLLVYEYKLPDGAIFQPRCHIFMTNGMIQYLSDCGHELAGRTVECPDWDKEW